MKYCSEEGFGIFEFILEKSSLQFWRSTAGYRSFYSFHMQIQCERLTEFTAIFMLPKLHFPVSTSIRVDYIFLLYASMAIDFSLLLLTGC